MLGERPLSYSDVPKFEFTTQVISEALRLYPPFWMVDRMALADDRAGDVDIPRGSTVVVFIYGMHHSPRYWENPESFDHGTLLQGEGEASHALRPFALRSRPSGMYRRQLRRVADADDSECSAQKIRFQSGSRTDHRSSPHGDLATRARNPHDFHRSNPTRGRQTIRLFSLRLWGNRGAGRGNQTPTVLSDLRISSSPRTKNQQLSGSCAGLHKPVFMLVSARFNFH